MPKKKKTPPPAEQETPISQQRSQQEALKFLREELDYLHTISLILMEERGVLPPFYGGEWIEEDGREAFPLWSETTPDEPDQLALVLLRTRNNIEPNRDLRQARRLIGMSNTWPVERLLQALGTDGQPIPIEGNEALGRTRIALALFGEQCIPAAGYSYEGMMEAFAEEKPIAIFVHVPVIGDGETFFYAWGDVEFYRAEVVYAESPEDLEMAVWRYRLDMALTVERFEVESDGLVPEDEMLATDVPSLTALFDVMVMDGIRYYGVTSPVREKQAALDVIRGFDGDLVVPWPLKPEAEPVKMLAEVRAELNAEVDQNKDALLRIDSSSDVMTNLWPQIRARTHFCMRFRRARMILNKNGQPRIQGYMDHPLIEWILADSLEELYQQVTLQSLRQLLACTGRIKVEDARPILDPSDEPDEDAGAKDSKDSKDGKDGRDGKDGKDSKTTPTEQVITPTEAPNVPPLPTPKPIKTPANRKPRTKGSAV
jgi:hypothetical protein